MIRFACLNLALNTGSCSTHCLTSEGGNHAASAVTIFFSSKMGLDFIDTKFEEGTAQNNTSLTQIVHTCQKLSVTKNWYKNAGLKL